MNQSDYLDQVENFRNLRKNALHLNTTSYFMADTVSKIEKFLANELSLEVTVTVGPISSTEFVSNNENFYLSYARVDGKFGICVIYKSKENHTDPLVVKKWLNCPQDVKIVTAVLMPNLINHIFEKAQSLSKLAKLAQEVAVQINSALDPTGGI
jgi:hypothetical protein